MDNKKLVLKDTLDNEYVFIAENCIESVFTFNTVDDNANSISPVVKFVYNYEAIDSEVFNFFNTVKNKAIKEIHYYTTV